MGAGQIHFNICLWKQARLLKAHLQDLAIKQHHQEDKRAVRHNFFNARIIVHSQTFHSEYSVLQNEVKKSCRQDKRNQVDNLAPLAEAATEQHKLDTLYKITRQRSGRKNNLNKPVKDQHGNILSKPAEQMNRWKEYFEIHTEWTSYSQPTQHRDWARACHWHRTNYQKGNHQGDRKDQEWESPWTRKDPTRSDEGILWSHSWHHERTHQTYMRFWEGTRRVEGRLHRQVSKERGPKWMSKLARHPATIYAQQSDDQNYTWEDQGRSRQTTPRRTDRVQKRTTLFRPESYSPNNCWTVHRIEHSTICQFYRLKESVRHAG